MILFSVLIRQFNHRDHNKATIFVRICLSEFAHKSNCFIMHVTNQVLQGARASLAERVTIFVTDLQT